MVEKKNWVQRSSKPQAVATLQASMRRPFLLALVAVACHLAGLANAMAAAPAGDSAPRSPPRHPRAPPLRARPCARSRVRAAPALARASPWREAKTRGGRAARGCSPVPVRPAVVRCARG